MLIQCLDNMRKLLDKLLLSIDYAGLDGMTVPLPPQLQPEEVATPVGHGLTYIWDMFDLDVLQKIIQADRQPNRMTMPKRMMQLMMELKMMMRKSLHWNTS